MDSKTNIKIITIKDLWNLFIQRIWVIVLAAVIVTGSSFIFYKITYTPEYSSTATMYILRLPSDNSSASDVSSDFSLALKVVGDCDYLIKSHTVLDKVMDDLALDVEYEDLYDSITTQNPENTRVLEVTVSAESPEQAKKIVDNLCTVGAENINRAMGFDQVNLYEYGTIDHEPSNKTGFIVFVLLGVIAAVLTYAVYLVIYILDDTIHSEEDIERYLGLTIIGEIPEAGASNNKQSLGNVYGKFMKKHFDKKDTEE